MVIQYFRLSIYVKNMNVLNFSYIVFVYANGILSSFDNVYEVFFFSSTTSFFDVSTSFVLRYTEDSLFVFFSDGYAPCIDTFLKFSDD